MSVILAENLTRRYGRRAGIEGVSLDVPQGMLFGFLGPNGAGKTTTIRVLLGFLRPSGGRARVLDLDCWRHGHRIKRDVGYLPGDLRLYPALTGRDHVRIFGAVRGRDLAASGRDLADRFALDLDVVVRAMSRGMRQKLGLILALAHDPAVLILDEPTASLDPLMQEELIRILRELASRGRTVFFSSHSLGEVERLCDRVAIVREGRLVADESLADLRAGAERHFTIRWSPDADPASIAAPEFLDVLEHRDRLWQGTVTGSVPRLIHWADGQPIEDLAIGHPDLDSLFRRFYE